MSSPLSKGENDELDQISKELDGYSLKLLYIEMRRLGYTRQELHTAEGLVPKYVPKRAKAEMSL